MKKNLFYSLLVLLFIFTGCSQKDVEVDTSEQTVNTTGISDTAGQDVNSEENLNNIDAVEGSVDEQSSESIETVEKEILDPVLFAFDKFDLSSEMLEVARKNSTKVVMMGDSVAVKLEGNCDEWGSDEYNYALGLKRAKTVKDVLVSEGYNTQDISLVSFGESNPVCSEKNESCWTQNRRVDFKISKK
ncbi:MAG: OmpA family protein [Sphaerochaetaceae bacterium]|nr:OmpA family protein [Sphaerochaetaceae bacterium]